MAEERIETVDFIEIEEEYEEKTMVESVKDAATKLGRTAKKAGTFLYKKGIPVAFAALIGVEVGAELQARRDRKLNESNRRTVNRFDR